MTTEDDTRPIAIAIKETASLSLEQNHKSNPSQSSTESPSTGDSEQLSEVHNNTATSTAGFQASLNNLSARVFSQDQSTNPPSAHRNSPPHQEDAVSQLQQDDNDIDNAQKSASIEGTSTSEVVQSQNEITHTKPTFDSKKSAVRLSDADAANELESLSTRVFLSQAEPPTSIATPQAQLQTSMTGVSTKMGDRKGATVRRMSHHSVASKSTLTRSTEDDADEEEAAALLEKYLAISGQDPVTAKVIAKAFAAQALEKDSSRLAPNSSTDWDGMSSNLYPTVSRQLAPVPASALPPLKHSNRNATPQQTPLQTRRVEAEQKREARLEKMGLLIERMSDSKRRLQEQMDQEVMLLSQGQAGNNMLAPNVNASQSAAQPGTRATSGRGYGGVPGWAFSQMTLGSQSNSSTVSSIPAPPPPQPNINLATRRRSLRISSTDQHSVRSSLQDTGDDGPEEPPDQEESFLDHDLNGNDVHVNIVQQDEYSLSINSSTDSHNTRQFHQTYGPLADIVEAQAISDPDFSKQAYFESPHMDEGSLFLSVATPLDYPLKAFLEKKGLSMSVGFCLLLVTCGVSLLIAGLGFQVFSKGARDLPTLYPTETPTQSPTAFPTVNADDLLEILQTFSDRADLEQIGSPQQKALLWLANKDETGIDFEAPMFRQRYALVVLYYATSGPTSWLKDTWLSPSLHECDWDGVHIQCFLDTSRLRRINYLDLTGNNLVGTLPTEICLLSDRLNHFVVRDNRISGKIPSDLFRSFTLLSYFDVSKNQLTGMIASTVGNLEVLFHFNAGENQLTGSLPETIFNLTRLKTLDVEDNRLTGTISENLRNLQFLEIINLKKNHFNGTFPEAFGQMPDLRYIWVDNNEISGLLPTWTSAIARMEEVTFSNNKLYGPIPEGNVDPSQLVLRLSKIDGSNNSFTGTIPTSFGYLPTCKYIDMSHNLFTGSIFYTVNWMKNLEFLSLNNNMFQGAIPKFPNNCKTLQLHGNDLSGDWSSITYIRSLEVLSTSGNFGGTFPTELARMKNLGYLDLNNCSLTGTIPSIVENMTKLVYFSVADNKLAGSIPSSFGKLTVLRHLSLNDNELTGTIPIELSHMNDLSYFSAEHNNLIGSIPSELASLEILDKLLLACNNLEGSIPNEICSRDIDMIRIDSTVACGCCSKYYSMNENSTTDHSHCFF